ncbi:hypothetical protein HanRHA438_Chr03g0143641 [Helianthus annuus]|nr:hypothetical protein HanHA89_Chr03g0122081 [Helianthus annuus]KAJ0769670.1 hypothetical protein HanLR1_Chr03g0115291 [Helianthus annuus]KAJ0937576.1 hypothetical protein HanRHA438_Chr03g0143641 [Helianthus annuus]
MKIKPDQIVPDGIKDHTPQPTTTYHQNRQHNTDSYITLKDTIILQQRIELVSAHDHVDQYVIWATNETETGTRSKKSFKIQEERLVVGEVCANRTSIQLQAKPQT